MTLSPVFYNYISFRKQFNMRGCVSCSVPLVISLVLLSGNINVCMSWPVVVSRHGFHLGILSLVTYSLSGKLIHYTSSCPNNLVF